MTLLESKQQLSQDAYFLITVIRDIGVPITEEGLAGELLHEWDVEPGEIDMKSALQELKKQNFVTLSSGENQRGLRGLFRRKPLYFTLSSESKQLFP